MCSEAVPELLWIEVASTLQIPTFLIVGLPAPEVAEARERVRSAILSSGLEFPRRRVVLNLSPASLRKQGTGLDLPMALAVLASEIEPGRATAHLSGPTVAWGELGLDGQLQPAGQLTRAIYAAWANRAQRIFLPKQDLEPALERLMLVREGSGFSHPPPEVISVENLTEAWALYRAKPRPRANPAPRTTCSTTALETQETGPSLLPLPQALQRILGAAALGSHHLLLLGPRGTGKSSALEWLLAIQPPSDPSIRLTLAMLQELTSPYSLPQSRPVRRIGMQARSAALTGSFTQGGLRPGEFALAHGGVLVADELPEWGRDAKESLREPLESARVTLTRVHGKVELPARFSLAASGNFCPCGGWPPEVPLPQTSETGALSCSPCICTERTRQLYLSRLSGPVLDRIDIVLKVLPFPAPEQDAMPPLLLLEKVLRARDYCIKSWGAPPGWISAAELGCLLDQHPEWARLLGSQPTQSLRSRHKILRLALSLAAWDSECPPTAAHFAEALLYRP